MASKIASYPLQFKDSPRAYAFPLQRKRETYGAVEVDHFWIPTPRLRPVGDPKDDEVFHAFCEGYRTLCMTEVSDLQQAAETYVMARLLPHTRPRGAMTVFLDAKEGSSTHAMMRGTDAGLQDCLKGDRLEPISAAEFHGALLKVQPRQFTEDDWIRYREFERELLDGVGDLWLFGHRPEDAFDAVLERWSGWIQRYGRPRGHADEKAVLDILSYESAAAFRRCYSAVWSAWILPALQRDPDVGLSRPSYRFLEYWHQQIILVDADDPDARLHPLHGHCFALHPATGRLLKTERGRELVGDWLTASVNVDFGSMAEYAAWQRDLPNAAEFGRLLRGFYIAYWYYSVERENANAERPSAARIGAEPEAPEEEDEDEDPEFDSE